MARAMVRRCFCPLEILSPSFGYDGVIAVGSDMMKFVDFGRLLRPS
jgi:hypothetical protein